MNIIYTLLAAGVALFTVGCAQSGSMVAIREDPQTGRMQRTDYSKYFDGADWLITDKIGVSVVVDNDTPISQQMFGSFTGKDSDALGTVTVYFWNLEVEQRDVRMISLRHSDSVIEHKEPFIIGPGPSTRTKHEAGSIRFFAYATELKISVVVEIDGQTIQRDIVAVRRTVRELKQYWGPGGVPPYPWFDPKYRQKAEQGSPSNGG